MGTTAMDILLEAVILLAVPATMGVALLFNSTHSALLMGVVVLVSLALFFAGYEAGKPGLRQIMPTLVLAAVAAAGRILFAPIPSFKPLSAIAIIAGASLGRRNGFMVGALAALTSNFFFGQGMWSPWQMYAWGVIGYLGGACADLGLLPTAAGGLRGSARAERKARCGHPGVSGSKAAHSDGLGHFLVAGSEADHADSLRVGNDGSPPLGSAGEPQSGCRGGINTSMNKGKAFPSGEARAPRGDRGGIARRIVLLSILGMASGLLYGLIINTYGVLGFVRPLTVPGAIAYFAASLPFDLIHGAATSVFLVVLYAPWTRRIGRVVRKYDLRSV
ncbi:MAG: hypothetical protein Q4B77_00725 [Coriobacteriaceae bacterium]|nr:hypothetical protein [Coriobacteriaceae bacterium]